MGTIEERAKEVGMLSQVRSDYPYDKRSVEFGYTQGATEQKVIDDAERVNQVLTGKESAINYQQGYRDAVEKACEWLEKELQGIATDELKENFLENEFKLILKSQVPNWLINFRKAMEE